VHVRGWQAAYRDEISAEWLSGLDPEARARLWTRILRGGLGQVFVAESELGITGFCALLAARDADLDRSAVVEISALYVDPESWRSGHGRALFRAARAGAHSQGFREISLWVVESNPRGRGFYESQGFVADGATLTEAHESGATLIEVRYRYLIEEPADPQP
jgi:GNAT superfamily N-acetyltransferase